MRQLKNIHSQQKGVASKAAPYQLEFAAVVGIVTAVLLVVAVFVFISGVLRILGVLGILIILGNLRIG